MRSQSVFMRLLSGLVLTTLFVGVISSGNRAAPQGPQQSNQQRPRRVGTAQSPSGTQTNTNSAPSTATVGEEVGEGDVVRVDTQLVTVPAVVTDRTGHPVSGLSAKNFELFEDGKLQSVSNFATTEAPFEIALLLDTSGSTRDELGLIRDAASAFIKALRPGDRVAIVAFKNKQRAGANVAVVDILSPLTDDRKLLGNAIAGIGTSNGTPFYDGLGRIANQIFGAAPREEVRGRRAVVALTDGVDSNSDT